MYIFQASFILEKKKKTLFESQIYAIFWRLPGGTSGKESTC